MSTSVDFVNHISTNGNTSQQASTNSTVTDTVIVKDTVTGIVTDTVKDTDSVINNIGDSRTQNFYPTFDKQPIDSLKKKLRRPFDLARSDWNEKQSFERPNLGMVRRIRAASWSFRKNRRNRTGV